VIGIMAYNPDTRIALVIGPLFLVFLVAVYYLRGLHKREAIETKVEERVS
jgi:AAT family amino acid transporter